MTGRSAALPLAGHRPPQRLFTNTQTATVTVRVFSETGQDPCDFDFSDLPVTTKLRMWFANIFVAATNPSGTKRRMGSAACGRWQLRRFSRYLAELNHPPQTPADLKPVHLDGYELSRRGEKSWDREIYSLRGMLRHAEDTSPEFMRHLETWWTPPQKRGDKARYTTEEFEQYVNAARVTVRQMAQRIRESQRFLQQWRDGLVDQGDRHQWERGWLLDHIAQHGSVPRRDSAHSDLKDVVARHGGINITMAQLMPGVAESGAAAILLIGLTGQNLMTLSEATVRHHRPDGHTGQTATAITDLVKYRRPTRKASMSVPLVDLPPWIPDPASDAPTRRGELHTPFGVFMLLVDVMADARRLADTDRLFASWGSVAPRGFRAGLSRWGHVLWAKSAGFPTVNTKVLRATWLEIHQQPVAHTETTLVNEYLARHGGDLTAYRKVVAQVLEEEVTKARTLQKIKVLSEADLAEAATAPETVARRFGLDATTLKRVLSGQLETVLAACTDNLASPFSPHGQPCQASFMMCLNCPCARATPAHLPMLIGTYDALLARKAELTPLRWAQRFASPAAQLEDVLDRFPPQTIDHHRAAITDAQRDLVARFLNRELDQR
ncbi:hypothetical protein ACQPYK_22985 [Streptosporangium sp. CA-135522]|uniref:hypothetical protein n=1 Tax=Streptosporangium sp. CA-135522 TaxID=3240072 RepID=UPI003D943793